MNGIYIYNKWTRFQDLRHWKENKNLDGCAACTACKGVQRKRQQARTKHLIDQARCKHCQSQCAFLYALTPDTRISKSRNSCCIAMRYIWFYDPGKSLTSESPMLLSETNIFPRCFSSINVQWGTLDQEQILHCSKTHSLPNNVKKAAPGCLFLYLWLPTDNFQSLTCQSSIEQSATVLSLVLQVISTKFFSQKHLTNSLWFLICFQPKANVQSNHK